MTARSGILLSAFGVMMTCSSFPLQAKTDFNIVGREMAGMLQNSHYSHIPFDENLSERILADFLDDLDPAHVYFTKVDTDSFERKYGRRLHELLIRGRCMDPANEIHAVYLKRVKERIELAKEILKNEKFDFTKEEHLARQRKEEPWPATDTEAKSLWRLLIKNALLSEILDRESTSNEGKEARLDEEPSPAETLTQRYDHILLSAEKRDEEDIANYFLSAVALAHDPHTDYLSARESDRFHASMENALVGIGARLLAEEDGATKITGIMVNGPADKAGQLALGDRIVGVDPLNDGKVVDIMHMELSHVVALILGNKGTEVRLKVEPADGDPGETTFIVIQRDRIELKNEAAAAEVLDRSEPGGNKTRIGLLTLPSFYLDFKDGDPSSAKDVQKLLARLNREKIDGLVFDLRGNGGGSLEEVRRMTGLFVGRGPVVQVKNARGRVESRNSNSRLPLYDGPMVVLTDKASASATEIFAGALQDYNRALIVGSSSTYGKGTVQQPMDIARYLNVFQDPTRAGTLKATIQTFYRVTGSSTQLKGVEPDVELPSLSDIMEFGEAWQDHALPHNRIAQTPGFIPFAASGLFRPTVKTNSEARLKKSQDFQYVLEDIVRNKKSIDENTVSLNQNHRTAELQESETRKKTRNAERRERFAKQELEDKKLLKFFRLTLDDLELEDLPVVDRKKDAQAYMRTAEDDEPDLNQFPLWPSGLDAAKREGVSILVDLIEQTETAKTAGVLKQP